MTDSITEIIAENKRRMAERDSAGIFDPYSGLGCSGERISVSTPLSDLDTAFVPVSMTLDPDYPRADTATEWERLRCRHDFEFWCIRCVEIKDKLGGGFKRFRLNGPQLRVAALLEDERRAGHPLRMIMLKARQWGGSTLTQMYMAWIQSVHRRGWNSLICAHNKDTAQGIRGMYTHMLESYPQDLWDGDALPSFKPYERSQNVREITGRGCRVSVSSAETQDSVRGSDIAMAHLSETAFWPATPKRQPEDLIRAVCGSIASQPYSLIAMESTANGVGNFFHTEWLRAKNGESDYIPVFVPWYEIEIYRRPVGDDPEDMERLVGSLTDYERKLWVRGLCLDQIAWFHVKAREYSSLSLMQAEYPTDDIEAFTTTGANVFDNNILEEFARNVHPGRIGELSVDTSEVSKSDVALRPVYRFTECANGKLTVWALPRQGQSYVVTVDIGGRSDKADWSVIAVMTDSDIPEVVAQWRGHIDHDLLANRAMDIGHYYNDALLVVESNTLETEGAKTDGDGSETVLGRLRYQYMNLYTRMSTDKMTNLTFERAGFHTNRSTKDACIDTLIAAVRDHRYIERSRLAIDEMSTYCHNPNGSFSARLGKHDDILITRAIALYVMGQRPKGPVYEPGCRSIVW